MKRLLLLLFPAVVLAEPVRLVHEPALSPDGKTVAFEWQGDIWTAPTNGGRAMRLTTHPALDSGVAFSPDGKQIAFNSERDGFKLLYSMPAGGGEPKQLTFHTDGCDLREWTPDGKGLLVTMARDFSWLRESRSARHAIIDANERKAESVLFDDYGFDGVLSPDGQNMLFMREGSEAWWRQGFKGSRAGQIWLFNRADGSFKQVISDENENRWPLWKPDGKGFYFVRNGNLWQHDLTSGKHTAITNFKGDLVVFPAISRDGGTLVFRVRFDLYRWHPGDKEPVKIQIEAAHDATTDITRVVLDKATDVSFTADGLQMAFISGGDVWVMDTELKEPIRVTETSEEERDVVFAPDGKSLVFVSDAGGQTDLWKAVPADAKKAWWESVGFKLTKLTNDAEADEVPKFTPDGKKLAWLRGRGDLMIADADGKNAKRLIESWNAPAFEFSPDGTWIVYSQEDEAFNDDIWLLPADGSKPRFNLSRHPDDDTRPHWSPDGKMIAWTGKRELDEVDIFYVNLHAEDDEKTKRERTLAKAREKFKKPTKAAPTREEPKKEVPKAAPAPPPANKADDQNATPSKPDEKMPEAAKATEKKLEPKKPEPLKIDFADVHERIHRIRIPNSYEHSLVWSPDSKKLAFQSQLEMKKSTRVVEFPDGLTPKTLSNAALTNAAWLKEGDQFVGLLDGKPATLPGKGGEPKAFAFKAQHSYSRAEKQRAVFDQCWQVMRDHFYDEKLGNRDWNVVREKYRDMAAESPDMKGAAECVWLMLGELNGSHLGFTIGLARTTSGWREETAHLGLRFDPAFVGPGWKVRQVIPKSPASRRESRVETGEIVLKVDGKDVDPAMNVSSVLNGPIERDVVLMVQKGDKMREVTLRPISYLSARRLLYDAWIEECRKEVEEASNSTLGYLHISAMDDASFQIFQ